VRYFYSSTLGTTSQRSHLPSWYECGYPIKLHHI